MKYKETSFNYISGEKEGCFYTAETKWINKLCQYAAERPEEVRITARNADGSICAAAPVRWFKFSPPRRVSEKQKQAASERLKQTWENKP